MGELDIWQQAALGTGGGVGAVALLFRLISFVKREQVSQAGDSATVVQIKALQEQIKVMQEQINQAQADNKALRLEHNRFDNKLHTQQRTITRMEMLLRQFSSLVQENGIGVSQHMMTELASLIEADMERNAAPQQIRTTDV